MDPWPRLTKDQSLDVEELLVLLGLRATYDSGRELWSRWHVEYDEENYAESATLGRAVASMVEMAAEVAGWRPRREG